MDFAHEKTPVRGRSLDAMVIEEIASYDKVFYSQSISLSSITYTVRYPLHVWRGAAFGVLDAPRGECGGMASGALVRAVREVDTMNEQLECSQEIVARAIEQLRPYAVVMMMSGGDDSLTAYHVSKALGVHIDAIIHVNTGTGIPATTQFVRSVGEQADERYFEADATGAYERYVLRKGFFGRGLIAHTYAYHLLKADGFRKIISNEFRQRKRGRNILLLNGARQHESENRMFTMKEPIQRENKTSRNWWVNVINDWTKPQCRAFLNECGVERNPVTKNLCRSGECLCGSMQTQEERQEAAFFYPDWGRWLDELERAVIEKHGWGWGVEMPASLKQEKAGQLRLPGFQPMCVGCNAKYSE